MGIPQDLGKEEMKIRDLYLWMYDKMPTNQISALFLSPCLETRSTK